MQEKNNKDMDEKIPIVDKNGKLKMVSKEDISKRDQQLKEENDNISIW